MHWLGLCIVSVGLASLAVAQQPIETSGYAMPTGANVAFGAATPQITFVNASNSPAGARNATGNNLAGARNSTIGNVPGPSYASTSVPIYIDPSYPASAYSPEGQEALSSDSRPSGGLGSMRTFSAYSNGPDKLPAIARANREARPPISKARVYTNEDLRHAAEQYPNRGTALSTFTNTSSLNAAAIAAQERLDRNLGFRSTEIAVPATRR